MIVCHCNTVDHKTIDSVIANNLEEIRRAQSLLEAVGLVWRTSVDQARDHRNPFSCTGCFRRVASTLQIGHNLFQTETIPPREKDCDACPRRAQCGLEF